MKGKLLKILVVFILLTIIFSGCLKNNNNISNVEQEAQHGSLELEILDDNGEFFPDIEVLLWTEENFGVNPNLTGYTKTTATGFGLCLGPF